MKFYWVKREWEEVSSGLYNRRELRIDESVLENLVHKGTVAMVEQPCKCILETKGGFTKTITTGDFRREIRIPNRTSAGVASTDTGIATIDTPLQSRTFVFEKKVFGKNKYLYKEL